VALQEQASACKDRCCDKQETSIGSAREQSLDQDTCNVSSSCADACCGDDSTPPGATEPEAGCSDACCDDTLASDQALKTGCSDGCSENSPAGAQVLKQRCSDGCCDDSPATAKAPEPDCSNGCCDDAPTTTVALKSGCSDRCCDKDDVSLKTDVPKPGCCDTSPSTDKDMISTSPNAKCSTDQSQDDEAESVQSTACSSHLIAAFDRFQALLARTRCICRTVAEEIGVCCCSLAKNGTVATSDDRNSSGAYIGKSSSVSISIGNASGSTIRQQATGCCDKPKRVSPCRRALVQTDCSGDACGTMGHQDPENNRSAVDPRASANTPEDVENDAAREHVVLSVSGMTCTGCSTKLSNVLDQIAGISKSKVTFVSGSASFDFDSKAGTVDDALRLIERRTGFKTSRVIEGHQTLDMLMSHETAVFLEQSRPPGMVSITKRQEKTKDQRGTYQLAYNPYIVGARDLLPCGTSLAPPALHPSVSEGQKRLIRMSWMTAVAAAFTIPVVVLNWAPTSLSRRTIDIVSLILATVVQCIAVPEFYINAVKSLIFSKVVEMDMLVVISITAAYGYSIIAMGLTEAGYSIEEDAFFETSSLLITLVLLGRLVAAIARTRAIGAVSVRSLQVETALHHQPDGITAEIDGRLLHLGDIIVVRPHSRIITDGTVISGVSAVDESMLTGETVPVTKQKGAAVIAGTINGEGGLQVRLTRLPGANSISDIAKSVENALSAKPKIQDLADRIASWFVPVAVGIAIVVFVIWAAIVAAVRHEDAGSVVGTAITYGIAVLAISCPCALGLAVPMVLVIAGGIAAKSGVIIKAADATERGFKVTDVVFDKTGTLTKGDLTVAEVQYLPSDVSEDVAMGIARSLVRNDKHPVSRAIAVHLGEESSNMITLDETKSIPGAGIEATWSERKVQGGNPFWLSVDHEPIVSQMLHQGMTCYCLAIKGTLILSFGLKGELRDEAARVVSALQQRNITAHIVSGDHSKAVEDVARSLGIHQEHTASRRLPGQKQQYVAALQARSNKIVMFCGDGTNDAVALAQADIGVQLGTASDVTGAVADVVLLGGLDGTLALLDISKRAFRRIMFNFAWSAAYNVFAILLASGAFVKFRVPPAYAGLGEIVSVVPVIIAAVSLLWGNVRTV
jgi:heavy metal translocating P-type ATPase